MKYFTIFLLNLIIISANAQGTGEIGYMEQDYKDCIKETADTSLCAKTFLRQMDSTVNLVYEKVRVQLSADDKIGFMKEHQNWLAKKSDFFKKQDENFSFQIKEGIWKGDMIWLVYLNKADFLKKRALALSKKLKE